MIVYARLQALPQDVFEASSVDGATWFQRTRYITLPLLMPAIVFAAVFRGIDAFRTFDLVYGLTNGGPVQATSTLSFEAFQNGFEFFRYGYRVGDLVRDGDRGRDRDHDALPGRPVRRLDVA